MVTRDIARKGILYVVATPIGNLEDLSPRAVKTLQMVDLVASEDTRVTRKLLTRFGIKAPLISLFEHNERKRVSQLTRRLEEGKSVALVSDAGTPLVSDPGYRLVKEVVDKGFRVVPIPGPSALLAALSVSGLPTDHFTFVGFLPRKQTKRRRELQHLAELSHTLVIYESPRRILKTLRDIDEIMGKRQVVLCRELTKKYEEILRGRPLEILRNLEGGTIKGEITLVVGGESLGRDRENSHENPQAFFREE